MTDRCPTCEAKLGWAAAMRAAGWPFYARCRACGARLRLFDPWQALEAFAVGLVPAFAVATVAAALDLFRAPLTAALAGAAAGVTAVLTMAWWLLRRVRWQVREPAVWSDPQGRRYLWAVAANVVLGVLLLAGATALGLAVLSLRDTGAFAAGLPPVPFPPVADAVPLGTLDPGWTVQSLDGRRVSMGELRGKTLFINLWATWCGPCVLEMPAIQALHESLADEPDIAFLIVSNEPRLTVAAFRREGGFTFPAYVADEPPPDVLETMAIPATFVVNPRGEVVFRHIGAADWNTNDARRFLRELR